MNNNCNSALNVCCVKNGEEKIISSLDHIDKRILVNQPDRVVGIRHDLENDHYVLMGRLSYRHCESVFVKYAKKDVPIVIKPNESEVFFYIYTNRKWTHSSN